MRRILVLSPHPDDESIGCGGTLRKHVVDGDTVHTIFLTSGEKGGHGRSVEETRRRREKEASIACEILGVEKLEFYREPDGALRATREVKARLQRKLVEWQPNLIYLPHSHEMHPDHRAGARALKRALGELTFQPEVLMCEIWTPLRCIDCIVDISPYVTTKRAAICAYESQCAVMAFDEAILALNRYRGEMHSWPGGDYAEVFAEFHP